MILTENVDVKIINHNLKHYKELGYNVKCGDNINIPIEHLTKGSHYKIEIKCDICGKKRNIKYNHYNQRKLKNSYLCVKCVKEVNKNTNLKKYGVENVSQSNIIKEKKKKTNLKNWGVENVFQSEIIKDKIKKKSLNNYGFDSFVKTDTYKYKCKKTNILKYGFENPMQNDNIKNKSINSSKLIRNKKTLSLYKNIGLLNIKDNSIYEFKCDCNKNHTFFIHKNLFYNRKRTKTILCTICNPINKNSGYEIELKKFIQNNYNEKILFNNRNIIPPLELDIYLPKSKLAFEFNGIWWHNNLYKDNNYHSNKTKLCENKGIQLIHIYEDDWLYKKDIIKSLVLNKLNVNNKIHANETNIIEIHDNNLTSNLIEHFLNTNHIKGFIDSKIKLGLTYKNELVSLIIFSRKSTNDYELLRFCNKLNIDVILGINKLFEYFLNNYNPKKIITHVDISYGKNNIYENLGFEIIERTQPKYYYIINGIRKYKKETLKYNKIYDSGNLKYIYLKK